MKLNNNNFRYGIYFIVIVLILNSFVFNGLGNNGLIKKSDYEYSFEFADLTDKESS